MGRSVFVVDSALVIEFILFTMEFGTTSASSSTFVGTSSGSSRSRERFSIASALLNGRKYDIWAQGVKVYYLGKTKYHYLTDDPPRVEDKTSPAWIAEDARIRDEL